MILRQQDPVGLHVRGRHAASDNMIIVEGDAGKKSCIKNLSTRIDPATTSVVFMSACEGTVCLRLEDNQHSDFWIEFNVDVPTLERLLAAAKSSQDGET